MNTTVIDKAFAQLLKEPVAHKKMRITAGHASTLRYNLRKNIPISLDTKLHFLQVSGWRQEDYVFNTPQLISFAKFYHHSAASTKAMGLEYVLEKWRIKTGI